MRGRILLTAILCAMVSVPAWSDSEMRQATRAEMDFSRKVLTAFQKAAPQNGPDGWESLRSDKVNEEVSNRIFVGAEKEPIRLGYGVTWQDNAKLDEAEQKKLENGSRYVNNGPDAAQEKLQRRSEELAERMGAAGAKGDWKEIQRLQKEFDAIQKKLNDPHQQAETGMKAGFKALSARDAKAAMSLKANEFWLEFGDSAPAKLAPIAGNPVYRMSKEYYTDEHGWIEGTTCALIGPWKPVTQNGGKGVAATQKKNVPHTILQTVLVCAQGEQQRARALLEKVDWKALKVLVGK